MSTDTDRDTCQSCPASREGCEARRAFARQRCCTRCTHPQTRGVNVTGIGRATDDRIEVGEARDLLFATDPTAPRTPVRTPL